MAARRLATLGSQLSGGAAASVAAEVDMAVEIEAASRVLIGGSISELDTPAMMVDLSALEFNIKDMAASIIAAGAIWRPHCKAIRSPSIAKMLVDGGAVGITCAKVSQAAAMVSAGVKDILIANEIVGHKKVAAMISLIPRMDRLCVACDDESNLRMISAEAEALGVTIGVLIDMNIGMNRCGIHWSKKDEIIAMSHLAEKLPGIEYRGLMGYEGHAQGADKKDELSQLVADRLGSAKKWVEDSGLKVPLVSGSGSGNYFVSKDLGTTNEIQAGGGVLHCMQYATSMNGHDKEPNHRNSIQLACQIISLAGFDEGRAIGDAGFKTMFPSGGVMPTVLSHPGLRVTSLSAEHTIFEFDIESPPTLALGDHVLMIPPYSDSAMILHHDVYAVRDGVVEDIWSLGGSIGRTQ